MTQRDQRASLPLPSPTSAELDLLQALGPVELAQRRERLELQLRLSDRRHNAAEGAFFLGMIAMLAFEAQTGLLTERGMVAILFAWAALSFPWVIASNEWRQKAQKSLRLLRPVSEMLPEEAAPVYHADSKDSRAWRRRVASQQRELLAFDAALMARFDDMERQRRQSARLERRRQRPWAIGTEDTVTLCSSKE